MTEIERLAKAAQANAGITEIEHWLDPDANAGMTDLIRVLLQAMREPSEETVRAGARIAEAYTNRETGAPPCAEHSWQAMIDHILSEEP